MIYGVILAAGSGNRFGRAKQFETIGGMTVLERAVDVAVKAVDEVIVVLPGGHEPPVASLSMRYVTGGQTRSQSVRAALEYIRHDVNDDDIIVVHDAARPLASLDLWTSLIGVVDGGAQAAVPVVPIVDSIRSIMGAPADRSQFVAAQTPQAFRAEVLYAAHHPHPESSDDASLIHDVEYVAGERANIKITTPADLDVAWALLRGIPWA